ncbi:MAG: hypothetical protein QM811_28910 [Pirellulales bacterium]
MKLWRRPAEAKFGELPAVGDVVRATAVAADGKTAAIGDQAGVVRLYDLTTHKPLREIAAHQGSVNGVRFSIDGGTLFTAGEDRFIKAWKTTDGAETGKFETPSPIRGLALVAGGNQLVTGHDDKLLRVWSLPANPAPAEPPKPVFELKGHNDAITAVDGSPDSKYCVSADKSAAVKVWSLESKSQKAEYSQGGPVTGVAVSADGKRVASSGENGSVKVLVVAENKQLPEIRGDLADANRGRQGRADGRGGESSDR